MRSTALFLSPHLDDVVFSCGGVAALLAERGWRTVLATLFTGSVVPARGFALACQLNKGLTADVDYMALRRGEDREAGALLGFEVVRWMGLLEAPHRGYGSAAALFGPVMDADKVRPALDEAVGLLAAEYAPDVVFVPQCLGNHVDHRQVAAAAAVAFAADRIASYRDTPYAMREMERVVAPAGEVVVPIGAVLARKIAASQAYRSQIGFQFGGADEAARALRAFAGREGQGIAAERLGGPAAAGVAAAVTVVAATAAGV